jgi:hypothetical protein
MKSLAVVESGAGEDCKVKLRFTSLGVEELPTLDGLAEG